MKLISILTCSLLVTTGWSMCDGTLIKRAIEGGSVEHLDQLDPAKASPFNAGFELEDNEYICDNGDATNQRRGIAWSVKLNQEIAAPVVASAWAYAEEVTGKANLDLSIYLDISYVDGTALWGQTAFFNPDPTLGWQRQEIVLIPEKPIQRISYYLLFRNRAGRVRFKDARIGTLPVDSVVWFDHVGCEQLATPQRGFLLRDVKMKSGFVAINPKTAFSRNQTLHSAAASFPLTDLVPISPPQF